MNNIKTKMIRITSRGFALTSRGRVMTPIISPYRESVERIWSLITTDRADVEEQLNDGSFIALTVQNFDKDNNKKPTPPVTGEKTFTNKDNVKPEVEKAVEVAPVVEVVEEKPIVETLVESETDEQEVGAPSISDEEVAEEVEDEMEDEDDVEETEITTPTNNNQMNQSRRNKKRNKNRNRNGIQTIPSGIEVTPESV